ncbi:DUF7296 family protein [Streptomyces tsukubensis]|uniref:DUF7296 family protein n=1 Tax=Streptomyces tsukubensis TaxID=83656 RepID=UPI00344C3D73
MSFYTFMQNNSGGSFHYSESAGISCVVIIEAHSADAANLRARNIGLYFDGIGDCPCCGDRWTLAYGSGDETPSVYDAPLSKYKPILKWMANGYEAFIHYTDGSVVGMYGPEVSK